MFDEFPWYFITVFTKFSLYILSQARWIKSTSPPACLHKFSFSIILLPKPRFSEEDLLVADYEGRDIAQVVSRRLPTAAGRVRAHVRSCGICGGQSGSGVGFLEYFLFPYQCSFHRLLHTHLSSGVSAIGQLVADVPSWLSVTPPQETKKKKPKKLAVFDQNCLCPLMCPVPFELPRHFHFTLIVFL
jgi:hypothetical protein